MTITLPGTCFDIIEAEDIRCDSYRKFSNSKHFQSICNNYDIFTSWWDSTRIALHNTSCITSQAGKASLLVNTVNYNGYNEYLALFLSSPLVFEPFEIWVLFQAIQECEIDFLDTCSTPNVEISLTAALLSTLRLISRNLNDKYRKELSIMGSELSLNKLELQVQNRESSTGGDFALLLEWRSANGLINICPVVFQAKRTTGLQVDISQSNLNHGKQLDILSRSKCNPAYIFYNCDTQGATTYPRLPAVKKISDIGKDTKWTSSVEDVLSLSVFMLNLMSSNDVFTTKSRREALDEILVGVNELELSNIATFSVDPNAIKEYEFEYRKHLARQKTREEEKNNDSGFRM
ncbi:hypothetical protein ACK3ZY_09840 [Aeromonas caviae]